MAQNREKGGRVVFIGNIPYGVSEEQIMEIFGRVGSVVSFRLVHDKETGKPKGFGFLEYTDVDAAASAVRNLNSFQLQGRELKVDYSNDNSEKKNQQQNQSDQQGSGRAPPPAHFNVNMSAAPQQQMNGMPPQGGNMLPALPPGTELPPGLTAPDAISRTLSAMPAPQLLDVLSQMKGLAAQEPQKATQLLEQAPQLSYAIFQALILLGLVDTNIIGTLLQQQQQAPQPAQPPPQPQQQPPMPTYPPYGQPPQQQYAPPPHQQPAYPAYGQPPQQHPGYVPTPPQPQPAWQPPPQQAYQPPPQPQPPQPQAQQTQEQMLQQVLAMSREQIFALDEVPRNQLIALRAQLGRPVV